MSRMGAARNDPVTEHRGGNSKDKEPERTPEVIEAIKYATRWLAKEKRNGGMDSRRGHMLARSILDLECRTLVLLDESAIEKITDSFRNWNSEESLNFIIKQISRLDAAHLAYFRDSKTKTPWKDLHSRSSNVHIPSGPKAIFACSFEYDDTKADEAFALASVGFEPAVEVLNGFVREHLDGRKALPPKLAAYVLGCIENNDTQNSRRSRKGRPPVFEERNVIISRYVQEVKERWGFDWYAKPAPKWGRRQPCCCWIVSVALANIGLHMDPATVRSAWKEQQRLAELTPNDRPGGPFELVGLDGVVIWESPLEP